MLIILNEKEYAEKCLKDKIIDKKPFFTLSVLAKYYYHCLGYRKNKISELLISFMEKVYPRYSCNKALWNESIEKISKNAGKYTLHEINGIWITKAELETIKNIKNKVLEKLAFTLLCLAKLANIRNSNNLGWVNIDDKEIFSLARVSCTVAQRDEKFNKLYSMGLIDFPKRIDNLSVKVGYIDDTSDKILFISDFRELGYEYLKYRGGNYTRCHECGRLYKNSKSHPSNYCTSCRGYQPKRTKWIICVDCGKEFEVNSKNNRTQRCGECQSIRNMELNRIASRERMKRYRENEVAKRDVTYNNLGQD